jgi:hypothetical protein
MVIGIGAVVALFGMTPAYADDHDNRGNDTRDRNHHAAPAPERHYARSKAHHTYHHAQPVYAPPPDYYRPRPSAGISLFIPFDVR